MEATEIEALKKQTTFNLVFLSLRNFGIQAISTVGFFILTIILGTGEVGLFAIVSESIGILGYFSDIGLASALIQKKTAPTKSELQTTFLIQQILVFLGLILFTIGYNFLGKTKHYTSTEFLIAVSLCFSFAAASLKTIPSVLLERNLNFKLLSTVDIIENIIFYLFAVAFAFLGFGATSYAIANFLRSIVGLVIIYKISPWSIGFSFSSKAVRDLFKFGIPYQLNSFIAVAKDRLSNIIIAGIIGRESFGILSWAQKGPRIPLSFMDSIMRITFPTFSRIQDNISLLSKSISKSIFFISLIVFPSLAGICLLAPDMINIIPKYSKWSPALIPLYVFSFNSAIAAVTTPLTNAFNATGRIKITTKLMIMWTLLTWLFYPPLSYFYGYHGTVVASFIVGLSSLVVWLIAKKEYQISVLHQIIFPSIATICFLIPLVLLNLFHLTPILNLLIKIPISILIYLIFIYFFKAEEVLWFVKQLKWLKK